MCTLPSPADNGNETVPWVARVQLARSIPNQRAQLDSFTEAEAERAAYEAKMALDGHVLERIVHWRSLGDQADGNTTMPPF